MDLKKKIEENAPQLEKGLIAIIFLSVLFALLLQEESNTINIITLVLQAALILFYFMQLQVRIYALLWAGFMLQVASYFFQEYVPSYVYFAANVLPYFAFGIIILIRAVRMSLETKNFELLTFIMGFLLVFQVVLPFIQKTEEVLTFYTFALSFAIGTIIYNDNLWHRYNQDEKNVIKYILIVALSSVIQSSAKFL